MFGIGVVEGFFGPEWSWKSRHRFCESLRAYGGAFYLYAPKRDGCLRKNWKQHHADDIWNEIKSLSGTCRRNGIAFGMGLSPYEIHSDWNLRTKTVLRDKIERVHELDITFLCLLLDDMKGAPDLADRQVEIVEYVRSMTRTPLVFCPTYYSDDPILDKVFGQRPGDYLEKIGSLPNDIHIFWTGSRVISRSISDADLDAIAHILNRKPFIWDNYFANDGPRQCKFLRLKPLEGRAHNALQKSTGWAFNLMNQPSLSEILFAASTDVLRKGANPTEAFHRVAKQLAGPLFERVLETHGPALVELGLDHIGEDKKKDMFSLLDGSRFSQDISDWLNGAYVVGAECLTD